MENLERKIDLLRAIGPFSELPTAPLRPVAQAAEVARFSAGEVIVRQGDQADAVYALIDGKAEVWLEDAPQRPALLRTMRSGQLFGETAVLVPGPPKRHDQGQDGRDDPQDSRPCVPRAPAVQSRAGRAGRRDPRPASRFRPAHAHIRSNDLGRCVDGTAGKALEVGRAALRARPPERTRRSVRHALHVDGRVVPAAAERVDARPELRARRQPARIDRRRLAPDVPRVRVQAAGFLELRPAPPTPGLASAGAAPGESARAPGRTLSSGRVRWAARLLRTEHVDARATLDHPVADGVDVGALRPAGDRGHLIGDLPGRAIHGPESLVGAGALGRVARCARSRRSRPPAAR